MFLFFTNSGCTVTGSSTIFSRDNPIPTLASTVSISQHETRIAAAFTPTVTAAIVPASATPSLADTATSLSPTPTTPPATPLPSPTATTAVTPTVTSSPTPITGTLPALNLVPGEPQGYLDKFRLVAYYGSPTGKGLGILGNQPREQTLALLRETAAQYRPLSPHRPVLPAYHMVVTVASQQPPYYYHYVDLKVIEEWIAAAEESGVVVILDIQPGRGNVFNLFERFKPYLYQPHVHLAIDPEFTMAEGEIPAQDVGQLYAEQINEVQAALNEIGHEIGLNRVLILHQFANSMLPDKELIESQPYVEIVIDGDGVGSPEAKTRNYNQYATEPAFEYGGFKLFPRDGDYPVLSPQEVMATLTPPPVIIIYQ